MKKNIFLLFAVTSVLSLSANPVGRQQARQQAASFLEQRGIGLSNDNISIKGHKAPSASQPLYVFNTVGDQGFVIVSGDDRTDAILGYTTQGSYDEDQLPPALLGWMSQMVAEIEALGSESAGIRSAVSGTGGEKVTLHEPIYPLITTRWNQGYWDNKLNTDGVYNVFCPTINGVYTCTGCVATAGAQIMYYYKHPQQPTQILPGYTPLYSQGADTSQGLSPIEFQWDKMKTRYSLGDTDKDAVIAVATLMLYCGYAAEMSYGIQSSSASSFNLAKGLVNYFDYAPDVWCAVERSHYSVAEWDELIYNELANRRPVIYNGNTDKQAGHTFICDGYDGEGLYHFNWGWGGSGDGYYKLQATNHVDMRFVFDQSCIVGIRPNTGETPSSENFVATAIDVTVSGTTATMCFQNNNSKKLGFGYGIGELLEDGTIAILDDSYENFKYSQLSMGYFFTDISFNISDYNLADGTHRLVPICLLNGETEWKQCRPHNLYFEVNVADGQETIVLHPVTNLEVTAFCVSEVKFVNSRLQVDVTVSSRSEDYTAPLYLFASQDAVDKGRYVCVAGSAIEGGGSEDVQFDFTPTAHGTWNLWVATDKEGSQVIGHSTVDVDAIPTGIVKLELIGGTITCQDRGVAVYTMTIKNTGETTNYRNITSHLLTDMGNGNWSWSSADDMNTPNVVIEPGETVVVTMTATGLEEGHDYIFYPCYATFYSAATDDDWVVLNDNVFLGRFTYKEPTAVIMPGDVNNDGTVNIVDVTSTISYILGQEPENFNKEAADVSGDGDVNIVDVTSIIDIILKAM